MLHRPLMQLSKWFRLHSLPVVSIRLLSEDTTETFRAFSRQRVPCTPATQTELLRKPPEQISGSRVIQVAILGEPNAGKSTLVNQLTGWKTCSVSKKVHTTRKTSKSVIIKDETQIVFLDTPGLVVPTEAKRHNLESSFLSDPEKALASADLLLVLHDVSNKFMRKSLSQKILRLLHLYPDKESILVLNKIDLLKEKRLLLDLAARLSEGIIGGQMLNQPLDASRKRRKQISPVPAPSVESQFLSEKEVTKRIEGKIGWPQFSSVFMISAIDGDGVTEIEQHLCKSAKPGCWIYNSEVVTDQHPHALAIGIVKGKILDMLQKELPYAVNVSIQHWELDVSGTLNIVMELDCKKQFTARVLVGSGGRNIVRLAKETEQEFRNIFRQEVRLRLVVEPDISM